MASQRTAIRQLDAFARAFARVTVSQPFREGTDVYKVAGKIFALISTLDETPQISLKCDPELARHLREQYAAVTGGYHLNKKHWNTVVIDGSVPMGELKRMVALSYELVAAGLPKAVRDRLMQALRKRR